MIIDGGNRTDEAKRLTDYEHCQGKTIEDCDCSGSYLLFRFTDGTWFYAAVYGGCDCCEPEIEAARQLDDDDRWYAGIITYEERRKLQVASDAAQRRAEYERLKAEFEAKS